MTGRRVKRREALVLAPLAKLFLVEAPMALDSTTYAEKTRVLSILKSPRTVHQFGPTKQK
jgi:hypothetical protein